MQDLHLQSNSINLDEFLLSIFCPDSQYPDKWLMHTFFIKIWIFAWIIILRRTSSNVSRVPQLSLMWTKFERDLNWHMGEKPLLPFENSDIVSLFGGFFFAGSVYLRFSSIVKIFQKQSSAYVLRKRCIRKKAPRASSRLVTLSKKRLWHWYFSACFAKSLRTPFLVEHLQLLLFIFKTSNKLFV